jgi:HK97 family phage prohead protease
MSKAIDRARRAAARMDVQKRVFTVNPEVRAAGEGDTESAGTVTGHAAVFDTPSQPLYDFWEGMFVEEVRRGAFAKTIGEADVRFLINHDPNLILARNKGGTLRLAEDDIGLAIDADLAPTTYGRDLATSMRRGDVSQMSIMFSVVKDDWGGTRDGLPLRVISEVKLYDVSAVTFPAFEETDIGMRSRDVGALLRSLGLDAVPAEHRNSLIAALTKGTPIPTDLAPVLRAAQAALGDLATKVEPAPGHSARSLRDIESYLDAAAKRYGLPLAG